jgi:hypothetical protein
MFPYDIREFKNSKTSRLITAGELNIQQFEPLGHGQFIATVCPDKHDERIALYLIDRDSRLDRVLVSKDMIESPPGDHSGSLGLK